MRYQTNKFNSNAQQRCPSHKRSIWWERHYFLHCRWWNVIHESQAPTRERIRRHLLKVQAILQSFGQAQSPYSWSKCSRTGPLLIHSFGTHRGCLSRFALRTQFAFQSGRTIAHRQCHWSIGELFDVERVGALAFFGRTLVHSRWRLERLRPTLPTCFHGWLESVCVLSRKR